MTEIDNKIHFNYECDSTASRITIPTNFPVTSVNQVPFTININMQKENGRVDTKRPLASFNEGPFENSNGNDRATEGDADHGVGWYHFQSLERFSADFYLQALRG